MFFSLVIFLIVMTELYGVNQDLKYVGEGFNEDGGNEKGSQKAPTLDDSSRMDPNGGRGGEENMYLNEPKKASGPTEKVEVVDPLKYEFSGYQNGYFRLGTFLFQWGMGSGGLYFSKNFDQIFGGMATMNTNMEKTKKNPKMEFVQGNSARVFYTDKPVYWCVWGYKASEDQRSL